MAYQGVGKCRFFIDYFQIYNALGLGHTAVKDRFNGQVIPLDVHSHLFSLNPYKIYNTSTGFLGNSPTSNVCVPFYEFYNPVNLTDIEYFAVLGHNLNTMQENLFYDFGNFNPTAFRGVGSEHSFGNYNNGDFETIVNMSNGANSDFPVQYDGFSIQKLNMKAKSATENVLGIHLKNTTSSDDPVYKIGSFSMGIIHEMPSSEVDITMTHELEGVRRTRTKGGVDIVDVDYTGNPSWGDLGAWEIDNNSLPNKRLARSGRRSWQLKFNFMANSDLLPKYSSANVIETDDVNAASPDQYTIAGSRDFYSDVIQKTRGRFKFIFQPDSTNTNPDGFAICKLDKNFKMKQVANTVYNISLRIREVW